MQGSVTHSSSRTMNHRLPDYLEKDTVGIIKANRSATSRRNIQFLKLFACADYVYLYDILTSISSKPPENLMDHKLWIFNCFT